MAGLEAHGLDLKKVAKEWGKKFATGSSVTKTASESSFIFSLSLAFHISGARCGRRKTLMAALPDVERILAI